MEWVIADQLDPQTLLGKRVDDNIHALSQEQVDALEWCRVRVEAELGTDEFDLEVWGDFPGIDGAGGTSDVVIYRDGGKHIVVMDYKFGQGVPVFAEDNAQGKFYGICAAHREGITPERVTFHVLQPRLESHTQETWDWDEMLRFQRELIHAVEHARPEYNMGEWCKFCRGMPGCPAQREDARRAFQWGVVAREDLPAALAMVEQVEEWAASVRAAAHAAMDEGATLQGWKLVQKRGSRVWKEPDEVIEKWLYRTFGLLKKSRITAKLVSPAQVESLVGSKRKAEVGEMVRSVAGVGTTLAREGDERPAVNKTARSLSNMQAAIEAAKAKEKT